MAITYALEIGKPATTVQVVDVLSRAVASRGLTRPGHEPRVDRDGTVLTSGGFVWAYSSPRLPFPDPIEEIFGFDPVVYVSFRMGDPEYILEQKHDMVALLAAALADVEGDVWFGFNGEITYLTRIAGRITADTGKPFWTPDLVALIPPHHSAVLENM